MKKLFLLITILLCACNNATTNDSKQLVENQTALLKESVSKLSLDTIGHYKVYYPNSTTDINKKIQLTVRELDIKQENNETKYFISAETKDNIYLIKEKQEILLSYDYEKSSNTIKNITAKLKSDFVEISPLIELNIEDILYYALSKQGLEFAYQKNPVVDTKKLVFSKETVSNIKVDKKISTSNFDFKGNIIFDVKHENKVYKAKTLIEIQYIDDNIRKLNKHIDEKIPPYYCKIGAFVIEEWYEKNNFTHYIFIIDNTK